MTLYLDDNPTRTISISVDDELLNRLNDVCRRSPELGSRSQLVRELLSLGLDLLEDPITVLPAIVAGIRENLEASMVANADPAGMRLVGEAHKKDASP